MNLKKNKPYKRLTTDVVIVICLLLCLAVTSAALAIVSVSVEENSFWTGTVSINLNDGKPIVQEDEFLLEPGATIKKEFFIQNQSSWDVYYRLYLDNVAGGLAEYIELTVCDGARVLYHGRASQMTKKMAMSVGELLRLNETKILSISFHFPTETGNIAMDRSMTFTLCADAVQTKNNPNLQFE